MNGARALLGAGLVGDVVPAWCGASALIAPMVFVGVIAAVVALAVSVGVPVPFGVPLPVGLALAVSWPPAPVAGAEGNPDEDGEACSVQV